MYLNQTFYGGAVQQGKSLALLMKEGKIVENLVWSE